ncbi:MAG: RagB/SusD family nutrient uptake outer membrane protein [Bacteroidales bacterium]|nr:RagB/SusD family nutrient uptake outer membrane protein [Bacteroidales bacterium]MDT8432798.1 RagB/SusD family nutrient uptake outer membrane protein [Bacteroidales bacterium]
MKRNYIYAIVALFVFALVGCEDLDTLPEGGTVTSSQKEEVLENNSERAEAGVNGIFAKFSEYMPNETALGASRHNDFGYPSVMFFTDANGYDMASADVGYNWLGNSLEYADRSYTSYESQMVWNNMYAIISTSNNVIASIPRDTEDPLAQFYLAQGLAVRSFSYLVLAQLYQFNYVGNETEPCVPIITDKNMEEVALTGAERATVEEVYTQIEGDIDAAISLLDSASTAGVIRADKRYISLAVAHGIRARMNLAMQNWVEAATDATSAIEVSSAAPSSIEDASKPAFMSVEESNWMWGIIIAETDDVVNSGIVNWISHMGSLNWGYANYSGGMSINKKLFESIPESDARKGWWIDENLESPNLNDQEAEWMINTGYRPYVQVKFAPYKYEVGTTVNGNDVPLMRIEEMYLIKAEAEAMSGGGSIALVDFITTYRDESYICPAITPEEIQEEVFKHRRIELWGEGLNWFDVMRLNKDVDRRGGAFPDATMVFNIPAGSDILLWRIPEAEIQSNPLLDESDNNPAAPAPEPVTDL